MRVKLQRASATDLPAYNPILPPSAITQVMLIGYPPQVIINIDISVFSKVLALLVLLTVVVTGSLYETWQILQL
jgi:hypothetical protein